MMVNPVTGQVETLSQIAANFRRTVPPLLAPKPRLKDVVLAVGTSVVVFRGIRPAQLVVLSDAVPDTLILKEFK